MVLVHNLSQRSFQLSPCDWMHNLDREQKIANILGKRRKSAYVVKFKGEAERGGSPKEPTGVGYSLHCVEAEIHEYRSGEM